MSEDFIKYASQCFKADEFFKEQVEKFSSDPMDSRQSFFYATMLYKKFNMRRQVPYSIYDNKLVVGYEPLGIVFHAQVLMEFENLFRADGLTSAVISYKPTTYSTGMILLDFDHSILDNAPPLSNEFKFNARAPPVKKNP